MGTSFIKDVLVGVAETGDSEPKIKMPIIQMEMGGLCLKTLQGDIFNNWVNKEWVDGDNGIKAITDVAITDGKLNLDSLNIAQKVYNMLNRIAVSGGSYKDWIETVYTTDYYFRTEVKRYTSSYKLEEIDNLREYILKQGKKEVLIKACYRRNGWEHHSLRMY